MEIFVKTNLPMPFCLRPALLMPMANMVFEQIFNILLRETCRAASDSPVLESPANAEHLACVVLSYGCKLGF